MGDDVKLSLYEYDDSGPHRDAASAYLACRMSELSEEALCASWEHGLEYRIWRIGIGEEEPGFYNAEECERLVSLGKDLGYWWIWRDGPTRIPMSTWVEMLQLETTEPT